MERVARYGGAFPFVLTLNINVLSSDRVEDKSCCFSKVKNHDQNSVTTLKVCLTL